MAKTAMICPFSAKACIECGAYRGRHYFMCFCENYRGFVKQKEKAGNRDFSWRASNKLNIPLLNIVSDPFADNNLEKKYNYIETKEES